MNFFGEYNTPLVVDEYFDRPHERPPEPSESNDRYLRAIVIAGVLGIAVGIGVACWEWHVRGCVGAWCR